ncbi:bifunctional helix-turn-helix transcriptional regulator/GNAT family N-acetyltransferase [Flagellimonas sediminis]|uniref:GNAT family N-acetyltransferase n=1 Tax=Flagellimonas sediminis TaxID=2696468 RepID=A0A6I5KR53_9FLAO|nr:bifunctional helix-turn-helix transcriptional regulator/GNAT family N-acetyltransferase [Allomuricauda sediminis]NDV42933.1 GNAT family N-acetyltransferase [Allomuricauda sediminis]
MNFDTIGEMALGSRLRALSETVTEDAGRIYDLYDVELKPKWFPVFHFLSHNATGTPITTIANEVGHSHPSVIKIVKEMSKAGLVVEQKDKLDGRKNNISLTQKGIDLSIKIQEQYLDVQSAIKDMLDQTNHNIWLAIQEFEYLLGEKSLLKRVMEQRKARESSNITLVDYRPEHYPAFKHLNEEWITSYFKIEDADRKALENPKEHILDTGGKILVALQNGTVLGVCALIKMQDNHYDYELAKMAVSPLARGKGVGYLLGKAIVEKARSLGASNIYLESNTILKPAISLYEKLGFQKVAGHFTPYERCNIQMELKLH